jgi:predicted component of type VI protein secretion system
LGKIHLYSISYWGELFQVGKWSNIKESSQTQTLKQNYKKHLEFKVTPKKKKKKVRNDGRHHREPKLADLTT